MAANLENSAVSTGLEKNSFHCNPMERQLQRMFKNHTISLISHASKVMLKILQARLQQYVNWELPDVQSGFRKDIRTRDQLPTSLDHQKSKRVPEKHLLLLYWVCQRLWLCGSQPTVENSLRWAYQTTWPEKSVCRSRSNRYNWTWNNRLAPNRKRSMSRLYIVTLIT